MSAAELCLSKHEVAELCRTPQRKRQFTIAEQKLPAHLPSNEAISELLNDLLACRDELRRIVKRHERQASARTPGE